MSSSEFLSIFAHGHLGLALTTSKSDDWTLVCLPSMAHAVMIGYIPGSTAKQVRVVPKSVGLVSPDANPRP
jgi:hypothetical protein